MNIDKYFNKDGYYDDKGCFYEDAECFIATGILDFCGCGMHEETLKYVKKALQLVYDLKHKVWTKEITHEDWKKQLRKLFKSYGQEYFMWYFLDNKGLTEHGGSVPGWLTQSGYELLEDLNELYK